MRTLAARRAIASWIAIGLLALACAACSSTAPKTLVEKKALQQQAQAALDMAHQQDPTLLALLGAAEAYAVFPDVGKVAAGIGGSYGRGVLMEHGVLTGYCDISQATIGAQLGAQTYIEVIAFQTKEAVAQFKAGGFSLGAQLTAVALQSGASANATYSNGIVVLTTNEQGLMAEASVGGQSFGFQPLSAGG